MELFRTTIEPKPIFGRELDWSSRFFLLGSCFAQGISSKLKALGMPCTENPYGITYNPISIASLLQNCLNQKKWQNQDLHQHQGRSFSLMHHGSINPTLKNLNEIETHSLNELKKSQTLIITLGTAWVYFLKTSGKPVSNCHRLPAELFERRLMEVDELTKTWSKLIPQLHKENPNLKIIFTVSPVRHLRDDFHENQISKSTLQLFTHKLCQEFKSCEYFPSYELMMDDLRDYRFYKEDMCHPNETALNYIANHFYKAAFCPQFQDFLKAVKKITSMAEHRPSTDLAKQQIDDKISQLTANLQLTYPNSFQSRL